MLHAVAIGFERPIKNVGNKKIPNGVSVGQQARRCPCLMFARLLLEPGQRFSHLFHHAPPPPAMASVRRALLTYARTYVIQAESRRAFFTEPSIERSHHDLLIRETALYSGTLQTRISIRI